MSLIETIPVRNSHGPSTKLASHKGSFVHGLSHPGIGELNQAPENTPLGATLSRVIFVACVDRNTARQEVAKVCKNYPAWWIDTGNLKTSGQVSVGRELFEKEPSPLRLPSVTTWAPLPSLQFPSIMRNTREDIQPVDYTNMSCAELALVDEQGMSINHSIASAAASLLAKMLVTKDLRYHCAYVSLEAGIQFVYNSARILRKHLKGRKGAVSSPELEDEEEL